MLHEYNADYSANLKSYFVQAYIGTHLVRPPEKNQPNAVLKEGQFLVVFMEI